MMVLTIIGLIAAALLLLILLLLAVPIDLVVRRDEQAGMRLYLRICRIPFKINGAKNKKKKKKEGKLSALLKRAFGGKHAETPSKKSHAAAAPALEETASTIIGLAREVLTAVKRCKVLRCRFRVICGGEDAALDYGTVCAVVYPLAGWLEGEMNLARRALKLDLGWDFEQPKARFEVDFILRIRVWRVLATLLRIVRSNEE